MSFFSYISFPREIDTSCFKSTFDKPPAFTLVQIKDTETKKILFTDGFIDCGGILIYDDDNRASFTDVFINKFIYSFEGGEFELIDAKKYISDRINDNVVISKEDLDYLNNMIKIKNDNAIMCRKQLYDFIKTNTCPNEIVEIYTEFVSHVDFDLGPPKEKIILSLNQVLTSELLYIKDRDEDKLKIEIHNTE